MPANPARRLCLWRAPGLAQDGQSGISEICSQQRQQALHAACNESQRGLIYSYEVLTYSTYAFQSLKKSLPTGLIAHKWA